MKRCCRTKTSECSPNVICVKSVVKYEAMTQNSEAATRGVLWKKVFLEISQNSQENTCVRVSFSIKLQASGEVSKEPFLQNTSGQLLLKNSDKLVVQV